MSQASVMGRGVIAAWVAVLCLAGCITPPAVKIARTTVVLLPDEDGKVGAVSVSTDAGSQKVDEAYSFVTVDGVRGKPSEMKVMGRERIDAAYAGVLNAQPPKPKGFILYFLTDRIVLTEESKAMVPAVLEAVRERKPTEITIFGHADSTGTERRNLKLSADRARVVADLLSQNDPSLDKIDIQYFGNKAPLVPSEEGKPEPRNRCAEVMIL